MSAAAVGRNDPCPCGSGRKFKKCHGASGGTVPRVSAPAAPPREAPGVEDLHRAGNADLQRGDAKSALVKLARAVALAPSQPTVHASLARAHFALGSHADAQASAQAALALDAEHAGALVVLGMSLEASDPDAALAAFERAAKAAPHDPEPPFRIGNLQRRRHNAAAAVAAYRVALAEGLRHPVLLNNLGLALDDLGERNEAEQCLRQALTLQPGMIEAQVNLADVLCKRLRFSEAAPLYRQAVAQQDRVAGLWLNFGLCLYRLGAQASAQRALSRALALEPGNVQALTTLAASLLAEQKDAEALPHIAAALERQPESFEALSMLLYARQRVCDWRDLDALFERQRAVLRWPDAPAIVPHNLLALPYTPAELRNAAENWVRLRVAPEPMPRPPRPASRDGRLRIAYLGSDFRTHALANLLPEVLERHDRTRFEVIGYSFGPDDGSAARQRFERAFDRFVDVREESFEQTAQRIRADGVGILFDTGGYVLGARSEIFALRPAPLQVNCIGFPGTLGADYYDYIVTDGFVTPPGQEPNFAEAFMLMPYCYLPADTRRAIDPAPSREACGLPAQGVVFCCFNAAWKIHPLVFSTWMRVLQATPGSVLWLLQSSQASADNLRREAAARGIDPGRLVFAPTLPLPAHLARHACADLFLDTFPCNAHTTANDALFAGLPLLTCAGETFASRVSGSHLRAAGLPELIAADLQDYEAKALLLGSDPALLAACRERLRSEHQRAPLFDMAAWTREFESRLLTAWDALES